MGTVAENWGRAAELERLIVFVGGKKIGEFFCEWSKVKSSNSRSVSSSDCWLSEDEISIKSSRKVSAKAAWELSKKLRPIRIRMNFLKRFCMKIFGVALGDLCLWLKFSRFQIVGADLVVVSSIVGATLVVACGLAQGQPLQNPLQKKS